MSTSGNLLGGSTSPYLLQHAANPVHWRQWGSAALAEAQASNRPILLSVGYAACHWCHIMAHESFEDPDTAALMNALFVNIKVDREERPDIDHIYMQALHALGEHGGWPLTMFLTPQGEPFWGGTYFPPAPRWGKPSFRQVLQAVADTFHGDPAGIGRNVTALRGALAAAAAARPGALPGPERLDAAAAALLSLDDPIHGGLRGAPKFPNAPIFAFLWQDSFRTGAPAGRAATHSLLERMSMGGIYDHLGGGYARYATDAEWLVPHFEKMLYDNAQILDLLALAQADRPSPLYAARADETVGWLLRDMRVGGAFAASEDADSEGEEGRFYVWTEREVDTLLGAGSARFKAAYDVTASGNWEGHTILRRLAPWADPGAEAALAAARATLLAARGERVRPGRDDKVLADWNALTVAALCRAGSVFGRPDWIELAGEAFDFVLARLGQPDGRVAHSWRDGRIGAAGLLEDQAALARAALALFEATGERRFLDVAIGLADAAETWFGDGAGAFHTTASDAADLPLGAAARPRIVADNATPAGTGILAGVFARLFHLTGDAAWRARAEGVLAAFGGLGDALSAAPGLLAAADLLENGATVVVSGPPDSPETQALLAAALAAPDPAICILRAAEADAVGPLHPAFGRTGAAPAAHLCRGGVCGLPLRDPEDLARRLRQRELTSA